MYASVNTNTMITLLHSHTKTLALDVQESPLHLGMQICKVIDLSAIPNNPSSSRLEQYDRFNNTLEVMEGR